MNKTADYIYGLHSVRTILQRSADQVYELYIQRGLTSPKLTEIITLAQQQGIAVDYVDKSQLERFTDEANHQGVALRIKPKELPSEMELFIFLESLKAPPFLLLLDSIQDPHNLGACLRTASAAGVDAVIMPKMRNVGITPTVRKVACGAAELLPIFSVTNLARTMRELQDKGIWLMGADAAATQTIYSANLKGPLGLVMGSEGSGLRRLTGEQCDVLISIPMSESIASLNVSVATGVCYLRREGREGGDKIKNTKLGQPQHCSSSPRKRGPI